MKIAYVRTVGEGGPDQCVRTAYRGGGSKIGKFLRTYFMDGPQEAVALPHIEMDYIDKHLPIRYS